MGMEGWPQQCRCGPGHGKVCLPQGVGIHVDIFIDVNPHPCMNSGIRCVHIRVCYFMFLFCA